MLRDYISITLGVLTLLIASGAVYGILTINSQIQAKPEQLNIPDYSNELNSLKSQINSMNSQINSMNYRLGSMNDSLSTLGSMKNSLTDVSAKLIELEKNSNQISSSSVPVSYTGQLSVILDKSVYLSGDTINISAVGAIPLKAIQVQLIDGTGYMAVNSQTWADSSGKVSYSLKIPSQLSGSYQVKLVSDQQSTSTPIIIQSSSTSSSSSLYTLTAQTDKATYNANDLVKISGTGQPNTAVTGIFTSASGTTVTSGTSVNADGTWTMFFQVLASYESGTWTISLTNAGQTKTLSMYVEPGSSSSGTSTLTAQTDKTTYVSGDTIKVSGTGQPNTAVTGVLVSPTGKTYDSGSTVNSNGSYVVSFTSLQNYETGTWYVNINNSGQSKIITFYMQSTSSSYTLTAQSTQSTYTRGALIQVTGTGQPNTTVNGVLSGPSGNTYSASTTAQSDGTYGLFFPTSSSYPAGSWTITVTNSAQSKTLYIFLQ